MRLGCGNVWCIRTCQATAKLLAEAGARIGIGGYDAQAARRTATQLGAADLFLDVTNARSFAASRRQLQVNLLGVIPNIKLAIQTCARIRSTDDHRLGGLTAADPRRGNLCGSKQGAPG